MSSSLGSSSLGEKPDSGSIGQTSPNDTGTVTVARESPPIVWLARLGAVFVAIQAYVYIRWIFSDSFSPIPTGPDEVPTHTRWSLSGRRRSSASSA